MQAFQFRCCYHLEPRIPQISVRVKTSECRKLSIFIHKPGLSTFRASDPARSDRTGLRIQPDPIDPARSGDQPDHGEGPAPAQRNPAEPEPEPPRGPGERGPGRRSQPQRRQQPERPRRGGAGRAAQGPRRGPRQRGQPRRGPQPDRRGAGDGPPPGEAETRKRTARAAAAARSPEAPEPGGGRRRPRGARTGPPRPTRATQRRGGSPRPRRGRGEAGGDGREQTRPREKDARAEAKMGGGRRSGADRVGRAATPRPRAHTALKAPTDPRKGGAMADRVTPKRDRAPEGGHAL